MASVREYFARGAGTLTVQETWSMEHSDRSANFEIIARLHLDFEANAKFVSFYIPTSNDPGPLAAAALKKTADVVGWTETGVGVSAGFDKLPVYSRSSEMVFTGRVLLYSESAIPPHQIEQLLLEGRRIGIFLVARGPDYAALRDAADKPLAFISHDSRDKAAITEPLALELSKHFCTVWYDQYALKVGDSLRESIEKGLRECKKCVFLLTPNFLANGGWAKREYDSIFTRELVENQRVILPVWAGVTRKDVYEYSPILADRVALKWEDGVERVAANLAAVIGS